MQKYCFFLIPAKSFLVLLRTNKKHGRSCPCLEVLRKPENTKQETPTQHADVCLFVEVFSRFEVSQVPRRVITNSKRYKICQKRSNHALAVLFIPFPLQRYKKFLTLTNNYRKKSADECTFFMDSEIVEEGVADVPMLIVHEFKGRKREFILQKLRQFILAVFRPFANQDYEPIDIP